MDKKEKCDTCTCYECDCEECTCECHEEQEVQGVPV
jgi:hypothetical protein